MVSGQASAQCQPRVHGVKMPEDRAFWSEFFALYREHPCLWQIKSKEYLNKYKKNDAYEKLTEKLKEKIPSANTDLVKKKINIYRSTFRKKVKKIETSKHSGAGTDELYTPSWTYYEDLLFLKDQEVVKISTSNLEDEQDCDITVNEDDELLASDASTSNPPTPIPPPSTKKRKKQNTRDPMEQLVTVIGERIQSTPAEDQHDHFGKNLAAKLRKIPNSQRIYAEKLIINDVMFAAELGQLNSTSSFNAGNIGIAMPTTVQPSMSTPNPGTENSHNLAQYFASFTSL